MIRNFSVKLYRENPAGIPEWLWITPLLIWKVSVAARDLLQFFFAQLRELFIQGFQLSCEGIEFFRGLHLCFLLSMWFKCYIT